MNVFGSPRLPAVWLGLVAITLFSWAIGFHEGRTPTAPNALVTWTVILVAAFKARVIMREFMEANHASVLLKRFTDGWLLLAVGALLLIYSLHFGVTVGPTPR